MRLFPSSRKMRPSKASLPSVKNELYFASENL